MLSLIRLILWATTLEGNLRESHSLLHRAGGAKHPPSVGNLYEPKLKGEVEEGVIKTA